MTQVVKIAFVIYKKFANFWNDHQQQIDLVLCLGDRYEMFAAVSASLPFNIKVAHFHGGETSLGAIDESFRHSITAMSHIHFTSTEKSAKRVEAIKGSATNVFNVGAMSLDNLNELTLLTEKEFKQKFGVYPNHPILVTFHPETVAFEKNEEYCNELVKVLEELKEQIFITLPNADTNGNSIREKLLTLASKKDKITCFESLGTQGYFSAIQFCSFMLGNTSSGIIEAASFGKYVVNLGSRQLGRESSSNVLHSKINRSEIVEKIKQLKMAPLLDRKNIYGDGNSTTKVVHILKQV
jgi:GDP/UDP-N,N'-diacetylbacillosamine 2-epimerase (hydrolysing)